MVTEHVSVEPTLLDVVDAVLRVPVSFLVSHDEGPVRVDADTVCCAEAIRDDFGLLTVLADSQQGAVVGYQCGLGVTGRLGVVEVARFICLQAHREFMEVVSDLMIVVEALKVVDFIVAIQVVQDAELITTGDVDLVVYDLDAQWLEQA